MTDSSVYIVALKRMAGMRFQGAVYTKQEQKMTDSSVYIVALKRMAGMRFQGAVYTKQEQK